MRSYIQQYGKERTGTNYVKALDLVSIKNPYAYAVSDETGAPNIGVSTSPFYRSFYTEFEYMAALTEQQREAINRAIDWDLMQQSGWSL